MSERKKTCSCDRWRSKAFDGLAYGDWQAKAMKWSKAGRVQKWCKQCRRYSWMAAKAKETSA